MPQTVLERHYRDRVQSVRQIAAPGEGDAMLAGWDFEDLVALCLDLATSGQQLLEKEFQRIFKEPALTVAWLQERRQAIEDLTADYLELVASFKGRAGPAADSTPGREIV